MSGTDLSVGRYHQFVGHAPSNGEDSKVPSDGFPSSRPVGEQLRYVLNYAILAPSGHNSQPWLFRVAEEAIELHADRSRALPVVDPDDRELIISCGAALFHCRLAMRFYGLGELTELLPSSVNADFLARISPTGSYEPTDDDRALFAAITNRHTNRLPYARTQVPTEHVAAMINDVLAEGAWFRHIHEGEEKHAVADMIGQADQIQASDKRFRRELASWLHPNRSKSGDGIPGYAMGIGELASYVGPLVVRTFDWGEGQAAKDRQLAEGSPLLFCIGTDEDTPLAWLHAGQALARVLLRATSLGLSASFLNQPIEVDPLRQAFGTLLGVDGDPQLLIRMGIGQPARPTPRRPLDEVVVD